MTVKLKHEDRAGKPIEVEPEHADNYKTQGWVEADPKPAASK
jgi:hypothetical protein